MKLFLVIAIFLWLICGVAGDWMIDGGGDLHWQKIVRGPFTLVRAFNEDPITVPTQD